MNPLHPVFTVAVAGYAAFWIGIGVYTYTQIAAMTEQPKQEKKDD